MDSCRWYAGRVRDAESLPERIRGDPGHHVRVGDPEERHRAHAGSTCVSNEDRKLATMDGLRCARPVIHDSAHCPTGSFPGEASV